MSAVMVVGLVVFGVMVLVLWPWGPNAKQRNALERRVKEHLKQAHNDALVAREARVQLRLANHRLESLRWDMEAQMTQYRRDHPDHDARQVKYLERRLQGYLQQITEADQGVVQHTAAARKAQDRLDGPWRVLWRWACVLWK